MGDGSFSPDAPSCKFVKFPVKYNIFIHGGDGVSLRTGGDADAAAQCYQCIGGEMNWSRSQLAYRAEKVTYSRKKRVEGWICDAFSTRRWY